MSSSPTLKIYYKMLTMAFVLLMLANSCFASTIYFPTSAVRLRLPINEKSESIFSKIPLARFQVLATSNNSLATDYIYSLEQNQLLRLNSSTGEIFMRTDYQPLNGSSTYILTAIPRSHANDGKISHMSLEVTPQTTEEYCKDLTQICYWTSAHFTIAEQNVNGKAQPVAIGALAPRAARYLCGVMDVQYTLKSVTGCQTAEFSLKQNVLYSQMPLDHEQLNCSSSTPTGSHQQLAVGVACTVQLSGREVREFRRTINVTLVDRNDNAPILQESNKVYHFELEQPYFKAHEQIGEKIIFVDQDTVATNAHLSYVLHNDTLALLQPVCNAYEADHTGRPHTIISCQLTFSRNGVLSETPYCCTLEARDASLELHGRQTSAEKALANVCLHVDTNKLHETDRPPLALALRARQQRKNPHMINSLAATLNGESGSSVLMSSVNIAYEKDVFVYRTAHAYSRVVQPDNFLDLLHVPKLSFTLVEDRSAAFGITPTAGILYVKDVAALATAPETVYFLNVSWHDTQAHAYVINVHLVEGRPYNVSCELKLKSRSQTCAQIKFQKQCNKFCGLATNGGTCVWRGSNQGFFGRNYASCVPDPKFCPDNVCDALEELNPLACPQDCAAANRIMGPHSSNDNKRGIYSASGTCICEDNGKCSCAPLDDEEPKPKRKRKNETTTTAAAVEPNTILASSLNVAHTNEKVDAELEHLHLAGFKCGKSCLLSIIVCPVILLVLLLCLLLMRTKLKSGKQTQTLTKKGALPPDAECDARNGDLPLMQLENSFKFDANSDDSKWEFDRNKLKLDVVLGEGEFGKVFKAYATEIAGFPGVTTVAVKMLKKGANSVEYMALLSEFQLLQEVSHPNVIKLLGACTRDGESPLIIIEYARYGSLRSYLRLSRKIECAGVDFTDGVEPITVKNVLTFAWQICKGMAYLTEIKLVHRDLAARNVLLADGKICKISDFGLTRDVYEDDAYLKRSRDRVPVKWMAPESLADHVYTTKSDVWAFGVLCWELITLGASPYPGIPPQNLYHLLKSGYRMERPENCSEEIYSIVRSCWTDEPNARPSFKFLASQFEQLLGNNAKYIELETNAFSNPIYCSDETTLVTQAAADTAATALGTPESLDHLWYPPKITYDTQDGSYARGDHATSAATMTTTMSFGTEFQPPPGYDMPRPLIEAHTTEQVLRYENDLRFPLNIRKTLGKTTAGRYSNAEVAESMLPHYAVPVKRGRSYMDMTNNTLIPDNLDNNDFEKHLSKMISFRFSSLLNLNEQHEQHNFQEPKTKVTAQNV